MSRFERIFALLRDMLIPFIAALLGYQCIREPAAPPPSAMPQAPSPAPIPAPIPPPPPPPASKTDPAAATVRIRYGQFGCTASILANRPGPGRYYLLSAAHCVRSGPGTGTVLLPNGQTVPFHTVRVDSTADLALLEFSGPEGLPVAEIATAEPMPGAAVWHQGFGVDRPGNRETGTITGPADHNGQLPMALSVSSGDSGSGIFRVDNGQLVSVVCCTGGGRTYGGGVNAIRQLLRLSAEAQLSP